MKLVENKVWEYVQDPGIDGIYKAVRDASAICYQTNVDTMKKTPKEFVNDILLKNGHTRPLEFGTVYLYRTWKFALNGEDSYNEIDTDFVNKYNDNRYSEVVVKKGTGVVGGTIYTIVDVFITTNLRVIMQGWYDRDIDAYNNGYDNNWLDDLQYLCDEPLDSHKKRYTFTMWMSRGCTDDNRTHITLSSICESTRFCNYSKGKFGSELTFIKPYWIDNETIEKYNNSCGQGANEETIKAFNFLNLMKEQEKNYMTASEMNLQPQQLKRLFPLGVKAELRLCGFMDSWENFLWRRCDPHADPECVIVANEIKEMFNNKGLLK